MPVYAVIGKLGTGKTKFGVWQAQRALREGRRIASNVDLHLDKLVPTKRCSYVRLPDHPSAFDLLAMGHGNPDSYDEDRNGVLLLDEMGTWLNTRSFQDKGRAALIDWFLHARKYGWDIYFFVQSAELMDKQLRDSVLEYTARCVRLDKVKIPLIGNMLHAIGGGRWGYLPRMHCVTVRVGEAAQVVADRHIYRGDDLHAAYDTRQIFRPDYPHGSHSVLPAPEWQPARGKLAETIKRVRDAWIAACAKPMVEPKAKRPEVEAAMRLHERQRIQYLRTQHGY